MLFLETTSILNRKFDIFLKKTSINEKYAQILFCIGARSPGGCFTTVFAPTIIGKRADISRLLRGWKRHFKATKSKKHLLLSSATNTGGRGMSSVIQL